MNRIVFFLTSVMIFSCASLLPREERKVEKIYTTNLTKKQIYDRSLVYFAKSLGNSNFAIQIKDESNGRIVSQVSYDCKKYRTFYALNRVTANFNIDLTAKDSKYRIIFDDIRLNIYSDNGPQFINEPSNKEELSLVEEGCIEPLRKQLIDGIEGRGIATDSEF
ncbi:DUF4468 domain-containing protein [Leptospira bandrabouensis]|uniref:DUF4468 domain-containing protein n=1 Tax=Leptospira bandrabouensis TaxID=2484903 RepID=UPI00223E2284|nr:DUF4468 domain-containing protein [Leptospira bandrabouensis]MCW7460184.1 DUF4468 domain-containing protein [Leptospira bandrabouensis]MCW7479299.1 DUF4468 domain-containing protein [Leptospira bandrabouensis]MCW7486980.1 DUF4468 domain-containing protein [Leptospira bandrabouensis]